MKTTAVILASLAASATLRDDATECVKPSNPSIAITVCKDGLDVDLTFKRIPSCDRTGQSVSGASSSWQGAGSVLFKPAPGLTWCDVDECSDMVAMCPVPPG